MCSLPQCTDQQPFQNHLPSTTNFLKALPQGRPEQLTYWGFTSVIDIKPFQEHLPSIALLTQKSSILDLYGNHAVFPLVDMKQVCQYTYLIWTCCSKWCNYRYWYTFHFIGIYVKQICLLHFIYVPQYYHCSLHMDPTFNYNAIDTHVPTTNIPLKCHICKLVHGQTWGNFFNIYLIWSHCNQQCN